MIRNQRDTLKSGSWKFVVNFFFGKGDGVLNFFDEGLVTTIYPVIRHQIFYLFICH